MPVTEADVLLRPEDVNDVRAPAVGDFDGDGLEDLALILRIPGNEIHSVGVWRGPIVDPDRGPDLRFEPTVETVDFVAIAAADLDGDGQHEIALGVAGDGPGAVFVFEDVLAEWHTANPGHQ